ncbi:TonB-dependent siderophore receptor [Halomonas sp. PAMB 3232]|uniref:TonB-dependent siderophore receptor n=1 Tax=Halomonas sp. PAMB 3232 TaxID=3075221 RepID=UPI0028A00B4A|nr:TonB-dependent siderophore receptor [Halomonas sp. PAMB 3232]WNL39867.1 TonB-dependent siderophore receptor [Halomonas sp. PAMB 3232]
MYSKPFAVAPLSLAVRRSILLSLTGALGVVPLAALAQEQTVTLGTTTVTATALKVDTPDIETPRSISTVSSDALDTQGVRTFDEAFQYRSGVTSQPYGDDNNADWFLLRGFSAESATYQDGLRLFRTGGYFWWLTETFGLERVDLLKGPASILYGEAPPGGVINAISKRPTREPQGTIELQAGNHDHRQVAIDTAGPVGENEDVRYRMVGLYRDRDGELDGTGSERYYFAPSLAVDFNDDTTVTFLASVQKDRGTPTSGFFPAMGTANATPLGRIDPQTNYGQPDFDTLDQRQTSLGYELEHQINDTWEFQQNARYAHLDLELKNVYPNSFVTPPRSISRGVIDRDGDYDAYTLDNRLIARTYTDNTENTLLLGAGYQKLDLNYVNRDSFRTLGDGSSFFANIDTVDLYQPDYAAFSEPDTGDPTRHDLSQRQFGFYVQDQLRVADNWIFLAGARYDNVKSSEDLSDTTGRSDQGYDDEQVSLTAGAMYLGDNGISPYVSYSESFTPVAGSGPSGESYRPLEGRQLEAGVKIAPFDIDGYVTVAAFDVEEDNTLISTGAPVQEQAGERRSQGLEVEGVGYLTDALQLTAAYTYTDARYDVSDAQQDERVPLVPRHSASARLDYDASQFVPGVSVGAGVRYVGESEPSPGSSVEGSVSSATVFDAVASYDFNPNWTAQVNVNNLTDKEYVSGCDFYCYYGASRSVIGSISYRW